MPLQPTLSARHHGSRVGIVTPGGSDLAAVVQRNTDKLRVLRGIPESGSTEALNTFLATFVARASHVREAGSVHARVWNRVDVLQRPCSPFVSPQVVDMLASKNA